jgi:translation elongation factor EF-1alpha
MKQESIPIRLHELLAEFNQVKFEFAVFGNSKAGKSTLLNYTLGMGIFNTGAISETCFRWRVELCEEEKDFSISYLLLNTKDPEC